MKKPTHGGRRKGAGRKPTGEPVVKLGIAIRPETLKALDELCARWECGRSAAIARMIETAK